MNLGKPSSSPVSIPFSELIDEVLGQFTKIQFKEKLVLALDELEVFFESPEQHSRDLRMVRDIIFSVDKLNRICRKARLPIIIICAVRKEVIDAVGVKGQEITRIVHDNGVQLSWHNEQKSLNHSLIELVRRKIRASERIPEGTDPIEMYFPKTVSGEPLETFLLDRSFYRPRDIMWRLTFAQSQYPNERLFSEHVLMSTESSYSTQLWEEIEYELSASYSLEEVDAITSILSAAPRLFFLRQINELASEKAKYSKAIERFLSRHSLYDLCEALYSHGALGNDFRTGSSGNSIKNRWIFRGDRKPLLDQRLTLNPSIRKVLSAIDKRKRGKPGRGGAGSKPQF